MTQTMYAHNKKINKKIRCSNKVKQSKVIYILKKKDILQRHTKQSSMVLTQKIRQTDKMEQDRHPTKNVHISISN
jgi:hypothetical protein